MPEVPFLDPSEPVNAGVSAHMAVEKPEGISEAAPPSFLATTPARVPLSQAEMDDIVRKLTSGWKYDAASKVDVIDRADLPFNVLEAAKTQKIPPEDIRGVAYKGHIYLVRKHHTHSSMVAETLFHEA